MTRNDSHLLSGAYAVHAVSPEEAAAVEAAMRESEDLRSEVGELIDTAVALGLALRPTAPPAALRGRLLTALDATPQLPREAEPAVAAAVPRGQHVAPRRRSRLRRPSVLLVTALAAALLFGGGVVVNTALQAPTGYQAILQADDVHQSSGQVAGGGTATIAWSRSEGQTAVALTDVAAPSGKVLQLWKVRGDSVTSAGLYRPADGAHYVVLKGTPAAGEQLAVSVEQAGGSKHPTTVPIVRVDLTA